MDAGSLNLKTLFTFERRHVVPLYQRPYVWKQQEQWEPLWEDVKTIAERELTGRPTRPHFLGAVVLDQLKTASRHIEARLVIDGQQRLTTLQLLLAAFRDLCGRLAEGESQRRLARLTENEDARGPEDDDERFKVWPTNVDQAQFRTLMAAPGDLAPEQKVRAAKASGGGAHLIAEAYEFFYRAIEEWLVPEDGDRVDARIDALLETLRERIHLVVIDLGEKDDAQVIFETLNARGTPLLPADLVKNYLFHTASLEGSALDALYEKHWKPFDQEASYWRKDVRQGRLLRPQIDLFLFHYLALVTRDEVPATHLFTAFKDHARGQLERMAEDHLRDLSEHARVFRSFGEAPLQTRRGSFFQRLAVLDTTTVYPFLLGLFRRYDGRGIDGELDTILNDLESYLIRRMICGLTTKNYNQLFLGLVGRIEGVEVNPGRVVREFLLEQDADSTRWPTDDEFRTAWVAAPAYKALTRPRLTLVLQALEAAERSAKSEDIVLKGKLTVEHLLPQSWEEHWPLPGDAPEDEATARRESLLHCFGNLTLLTNRLNPAVSNAAWSRKREGILQHSALALNRYFQNVETWDEKVIGRRTRELFETARWVWSRPEVT